MKWEKKSEQTEKYCAAHNVDCPYHHENDIEVLVMKPNSTSSLWLCPEAVQEVGKFKDEAVDKNKLF